MTFRNQTNPGDIPASISDMGRVIETVRDMQRHAGELTERLTGIVGKIYGEGESKESQDALRAHPHAAGALGTLEVEMKILGSELEVIERKIARLEKFAD
jgi:prefoldin subunit 5